MKIIVFIFLILCAAFSLAYIITELTMNHDKFEDKGEKAWQSVKNQEDTDDGNNDKWQV